MKQKPLLKDLGNIGLVNYMERLEEYCNENPADANAQIDLMSISAKSGCLLKYEKRMNIFLNDNPLNNLAHRLHGKYLLLLQRDHKAAAESLRIACEINPSEPAWVKYFANLHDNYYETLPGDVLYTAIPKNGSTTIKTFCAGLHGQPEDKAHSLYGNPYFSASPVEEKLSSRCKKVVILRDPIDRFISYHAKNISECDSLAHEVKRPGLPLYFGLKLKPTIEELAMQIWKYAFSFNDVFHHILPQCAYVRRLSEYTLIGGMGDINRTLKACWPNQPEQSKHHATKRMTSNEKKEAVPSKIAEFLLEVFSDDMKLIEAAEKIHGICISGKHHHSFTPSIGSAMPSSGHNSESRSDQVPSLKHISTEAQESISYPTNIVIDAYAALLNSIKTPESIFSKVKDALTSGRGFSLVRIGDGEGSILGYNDITPSKDMEDILDIQFGTSLEDSEITIIRQDLVKSIEQADILGIPGRKRSLLTNSSCRVQRGIISVYSHFHRSGLPRQYQELTTANIHIRLDTTGELAKLIQMTSKVTLITCRTELSEYFYTHFPHLSSFTLLEVPADHRFGQKPVYCRHFPDRYNEIKKIILSSDLEGELVLVAAGVPGKTYCSFIKLAGGVAIDIGSIADKLAGVRPRPYIR